METHVHYMRQLPECEVSIPDYCGTRIPFRFRGYPESLLLRS